MTTATRTKRAYPIGAQFLLDKIRAYAKRIDPDTGKPRGYVYGSREWLAAKLDICEAKDGGVQTIYRYVKALEKAGKITVQRRRGRDHPNRIYPVDDRTGLSGQMPLFDRTGLSGDDRTGLSGQNADLYIRGLASSSKGESAAAAQEVRREEAPKELDPETVKALAAVPVPAGKLPLDRVPAVRQLAAIDPARARQLAAYLGRRRPDNPTGMFRDAWAKPVKYPDAWHVPPPRPSIADIIAEQNARMEATRREAVANAASRAAAKARAGL